MQAIDAPIVGSGLRGSLRRLRLSVGDHIEACDADVIFVDNHAGNRAMPNQANIKKCACLLLDHGRHTRGVPAFLAILERQESLSRRLYNVRARWERIEFEHAKRVRAHCFPGAWCPADRVQPYRRTGKGFAREVFHHDAANDGGVQEAAWHKSQQRSEHVFEHAL
jgi:hypothetical protein